jgi:hypothetical protein
VYLQIDRNTENGAYAWKNITWRVIVAIKTKVSFWPDESNNAGNCVYHLVPLHEVVLIQIITRPTIHLVLVIYKRWRTGFFIF